LPMIKRSQNQQLFGPDYVPFRLLIARYCFLLLFSKIYRPVLSNGSEAYTEVVELAAGSRTLRRSLFSQCILHSTPGTWCRRLPSPAELPSANASRPL
jgi:hypothetical protein